jgi:hypothetical protein
VCKLEYEKPVVSLRSECLLAVTREMGLQVGLSLLKMGRGKKEMSVRPLI